MDEWSSALAIRESTATIVAAYLERNQTGGDQIAALISSVYQALANLATPAVEPVTAQTPAVPIRQSVHRDYVICLDCGWRGLMLRKHITSVHSLTVEEYRARWNLPINHALVAPSYSKRRAVMAKQSGLGRKS
jgi:predicted transcriptional regulator